MILPTIQSEPRLQLLQHWLQQQLQTTQFDIQTIVNDASFRRYFRITYKNKTIIAMDAPPDKENLIIFIDKARIFKALHLQVPAILASDSKNGFLLLSDLGNDLYLKILNQENRTQLYDLAIATLFTMQTYVSDDSKIIPLYDEALLMRELQLFPTWYLKADAITSTALTKIFKLLIDSALNQPQVLVHRDYHSRNLLLLPNNQVGIVDFQDAVFGPITYDLVSLLRDCYINWSEKMIENYLRQFYQHWLDRKLKNISYEELVRWFDWMGLQRHLKVLGLFTRLAVRDNKPAYLQDLPRVLNYARVISKKYREFAILIDILERKF